MAKKIYHKICVILKDAKVSYMFWKLDAKFFNIVQYNENFWKKFQKLTLLNVEIFSHFYPIAISSHLQCSIENRNQFKV
jgi:hypothetical protein